MNDFHDIFFGCHRRIFQINFAYKPLLSVTVHEHCIFNNASPAVPRCRQNDISPPYVAVISPPP